MQTADVLILGAGAAGLLCAREAGLRGLRVTLLDHADRVGKKILISGGGRCNFTNRHTSPDNYLSENPHFARSALARYTPDDFLELIHKHGIAYHEKTLGQLFCDGSAQQVVTLLERECSDAGVQTRLGVEVDSIQRVPAGFQLLTRAGESFLGRSLVIATGGPSIPKMGATGYGYEIAKLFGINLIEPRPALVPLVLSEADQQAWCDLAGVAVEVIARTGKGRHLASFQERLLLTHRGLSGPAGLQISSFWRPEQPIVLDLAPGQTIFPRLLQSTVRDEAAAATALREAVPTRLATRWVARHQTGWSNQALARLEEQLHTWTVTPVATEGFAKAEVTAGGVDTRDLDARTMESRSVPGLYFIGEVVDVTGWLGGYNFQWAWASGAAAGRSIPM